MARILTAMLHELRNDKEMIDQTILMLERLVLEQDKESRRPVSDAANSSDGRSKPPRKKGAERNR